MIESNDLRDIIEEGKRIKKQWQESRARFESKQREIRRQLAGERVDQMVKSYQDAIKCLEDTSGIIRMVALEILLGVWRTHTTSEFRQKCEQMAIEDSDPQVRSMAVIALGSVYENTNDPVVGKLLASLIKEHSLPSGIRESAYHSLYSLCGQSAAWIELNLNGFRFPNDVDWEFVNSYG